MAAAPLHTGPIRIFITLIDFPKRHQKKSSEIHRSAVAAELPRGDVRSRRRRQPHTHAHAQKPGG